MRSYISSLVRLSGIAQAIPCQLKPSNIWASLQRRLSGSVSYLGGKSGNFSLVLEDGVCRICFLVMAVLLRLVARMRCAVIIRHQGKDGRSARLSLPLGTGLPAHRPGPCAATQSLTRPSSGIAPPAPQSRLVTGRYVPRLPWSAPAQLDSLVG